MVEHGLRQLLSGSNLVGCRPPHRGGWRREPDLFTLRLARVTALGFKEVRPGSFIYTIQAPAVGPNAAQSKAVVILQWDVRGTGISRVVVAARGQLLRDGEAPIGEYEFVTDRPGRHEFLLIGYNQANQPLHVETREITMPSLGGLGR